MPRTDLPPLSARGDDEAEVAGPAALDAPRGGLLNYEALRFPGCQPISLSRDEFEDFDDRLEYWDARTGTAWVVADKYGVHEGTSRRLPHLAERIASVAARRSSRTDRSPCWYGTPTAGPNGRWRRTRRSTCTRRAPRRL